MKLCHNLYDKCNENIKKKSLTKKQINNLFKFYNRITY